MKYMACIIDTNNDIGTFYLRWIYQTSDIYLFCGFTFDLFCSNLQQVFIGVYKIPQ